MNAAVVLSRLRRFLLAFSALLLGGAVFELWLIDHMEDFVQLVPFALCGAGLLAVLAVLIYPRRATVLGLRVCMGVVILGSLYGTYEHVINNLAFQREVYPDAPVREVVTGTLGGANPLLAPGILAAAATLALAAAYHHPASRHGAKED
ncbi:MAG: hypothetical protein H0T45_03175 [Pyrinomonadaceae bacterium]|nr:hypothetical protein [Pyrinomonadaceae bacterium]